MSDLEAVALGIWGFVVIRYALPLLAHIAVAAYLDGFWLTMERLGEGVVDGMRDAVESFR